MTRFSNYAYLESPDFPFHSGLYRLESGKNIETHCHEFIELVFITEGSGIHIYKGEQYNICEGDVFIIEPEVEHSYLVDNGLSMTLYNILFHKSFLSHELESLSRVAPFVNFFYVEPFLRSTLQFNSHLTLEPQQRIEIMHKINHIMKEYSEKQIGYRILVKTGLIELLINFSRYYELQLHRPMTSLGSESQIIERVCDYIERHYALPLSLLQLSQMCGMSMSSFTAKFKLYTGKTFIEFRNESRIRIARMLLADTDEKIVEIAQQVGFDDLSSFNKLFKKVIGASPGTYRRQHRSILHHSIT